jgi:simple sugar transport system permease protein
MAPRFRRFLYNNAPLLTVMAIFVGAYLIAGQIYPAMQKPQVFFNLFINNASLLIVSIGMTLVILTKGIDLSVAAVIALTSARPMRPPAPITTSRMSPIGPVLKTRPS